MMVTKKFGLYEVEHYGPVRGTMTYRIAGEPEEYGSSGYLVKQNTVTVWGDGTAEVSGNFSKRKLEAIVTAIIKNEREGK